MGFALLSAPVSGAKKRELKTGFVNKDTFRAIGIGYPGIVGEGESLTRRKAAAYEAALLEAQGIAKERLGDKYRAATKIKSHCDESVKCVVLLEITIKGLQRSSTSRSLQNLTVQETDTPRGEHLVYAIALDTTATEDELKHMVFSAAYCNAMGQEFSLSDPGIEIPGNAQNRLITRMTQGNMGNSWKIQVTSSSEEKKLNGVSHICTGNDNTKIIVADGKLLKYTPGSNHARLLSKARPFYQSNNFIWENYSFSDVVFQCSKSQCEVSLIARKIPSIKPSGNTQTE